MYVRQLTLHNYRNYTRLNLELANGLHFFVGPNAQGKTNLLESVYFLATTRSPRTTNERELINWQALHEELPYLRVAGQVARASGLVRLEITMMARDPTALASEGSGRLALAKRIQVNGVPRRAFDLLGQLNVVLFSPRDIELIDGAPAARRRYLDITNSQIDPQYVRALQRYNRVLLQRNSLLRALRERQARPDQLEYWDDLLVENGVYLLRRRHHCLWALNRRLQEIHPRLTGRDERLRIAYVSSLEEPAEPENLLRERDAAAEEAALARTFRAALAKGQAREIAAGVSLFGPHRDDLRFLVNSIDMTTFGSRGQQRTAALSLKLAEARYMRDETNETPVLLLDDILSELDQSRRAHIADWLRGEAQALIATTDLREFGPALPSTAHIHHVQAGTVT